MGDAIKKRKAADQPGANEQQIPLPERCLKELVLLLRPVWLAAGRPTVDAVVRTWQASLPTNEARDVAAELVRQLKEHGLLTRVPPAAASVTPCAPATLCAAETDDRGAEGSRAASSPSAAH